MSTLVRAPVRPLAEGEHALGDAQARYLTRVHRLREGDRFVAFDASSAVECDATIVRVEASSVVARFGAARAAIVRATREITLLQGLAKGDKCDAIVRDATELGATRIALVATARSIVRLEPAKGRARAERWRRIAEEAARQSGRGDVPQVDEPLGWGEAIAGVPSATARFCLYERATERLGPLLAPALAADAPLAFAVGPEGGIADDEARAAEAAGFRLVSLGARILRTETVAAAVLGAVAVFDGGPS